MRVRTRLALTFLALAALFLVPIRYAGVRLNDLQEMAVERRSQHAAATQAIGTFQAALANYDSYQRAYLVTLDTRMERRVADALDRMALQLDRLERAGYPGATAGLTVTLDSAAALAGAIDRLLRTGNVDEATAVFQNVSPLRAEMESGLVEVANAVDRESEADFARAEEMSATAATTTVAATLAAILLGLVVSVWTTRTLTVPLHRLSAQAARVADGRFEDPEGLPYDRDDEIGALSRSFRAMTQRLGELDRLKAEFIGVASHELKTPISVIRSYAELLEEELQESGEDRHEKVLGAIMEQTDVMTRLVSRMLDIGRLEAGAYEMEPEDLHVKDLLNGLRNAFDILARENGIRFRTEVDERAPVSVHADPDMLRNEVLGNLVSNALRYTPRGGEVRVRVWQESGEVVFEVSDTGPGVPEEKRPYIFDKYYEGDRTQTMGSGLGLAVAKEVVEAHGGRITLEPPAREGATFRVYLPAESAHAPAPEPVPG